MGNFGMKMLLMLVCIDLVLGADLNFLRSTLEDHFSKNRHHDINPANKQLVLEYIRDQFVKGGLDTELQPFLHSRLKTSANFTNVIGVKKGSNYGTAEDRVIGLGTHYDTVQKTSGVDDNGSGMAAMLHVIKYLHSTGGRWENTMIFVAFDAEELGLEGSKVFVEEWLAPFVKNSSGPDPRGFFILDTILEYNTSANSQIVKVGFEEVFPKTVASINSDGNKGDFMAVIYRGKEDVALATSINASWTSKGEKEFEIETLAIPPVGLEVIGTAFGDLARSDHFSFWIGGVPAIFLTDTANFRGDMITCYHHPCDNLATMLTDDNIRFLGKVTDSLITSMDNLAVRKDTSNSSHLLPNILGVMTLAVLTWIYNTSQMEIQY